MKIIAVGWNYPEHNKEMQLSGKPEVPVLFMKPESAVLKNGKPFFIPDFSQRVEYEAEIVIRISRLGKNIAPRFADRYYDAVTIGIDFTARDLQSRVRTEGNPWEISKAFDNSGAVGSFIPVEEAGNIQNLSFRLDINGNTVQEGNTGNMIFPVDEIIAYASRFFTLKMGDYIFTGTPPGTGPVHIDDHLEGYIGQKKLLDFNIK